MIRPTPLERSFIFETQMVIGIIPGNFTERECLIIINGCRTQVTATDSIKHLQVGLKVAIGS